MAVKKAAKKATVRDSKGNVVGVKVEETSVDALVMTSSAKAVLDAGMFRDFLVAIRCKGLIDDCVLMFKDGAITSYGMCSVGVVSYCITVACECEGCLNVSVSDLEALIKVSNRFSGKVAITASAEKINFKQSGKSATISLADNKAISSFVRVSEMDITHKRYSSSRITIDATKHTPLKVSKSKLSSIVGDYDVLTNTSFTFKVRKSDVLASATNNVDVITQSIAKNPEGVYVGTDDRYDYGIEKVLSSIPCDCEFFFFPSKALITAYQEDGITADYLVAASIPVDSGE